MEYFDLLVCQASEFELSNSKKSVSFKAVSSLKQEESLCGLLKRISMPIYLSYMLILLGGKRTKMLIYLKEV